MATSKLVRKAFEWKKVITVPFFVVVVPFDIMIHSNSTAMKGWSGGGGAMVLGKLPVQGRPTYCDYSRAWAYCACSRSGGGGLDIVSLVYHFSLLSPSLWETARYRLKYCLKGPLSPKQPTNQLL